MEVAICGELPHCRHQRSLIAGRNKETTTREKLGKRTFACRDYWRPARGCLHGRQAKSFGIRGKYQSKRTRMDATQNFVLQKSGPFHQRTGALPLDLRQYRRDLREKLVTIARSD